MDRNNRNVTHGTVVVHQNCHHSRHIRHRSPQLGYSGRRQHTETGCQGTLQSHIDNVRYFFDSKQFHINKSTTEISEINNK